MTMNSGDAIIIGFASISNELVVGEGAYDKQLMYCYRGDAKELSKGDNLALLVSVFGRYCYVLTEQGDVGWVFGTSIRSNAIG